MASILEYALSRKLRRSFVRLSVVGRGPNTSTVPRLRVLRSAARGKLDSNHNGIYTYSRTSCATRVYIYIYTACVRAYARTSVSETLGNNVVRVQEPRGREEESAVESTRVNSRLTRSLFLCGSLSRSHDYPDRK